MSLRGSPNKSPPRAWRPSIRVQTGPGTGPSHGRKLDFLLQEMAREVNTLGAETPEVEVTRSVVELKADVERMREQVQNVL